MFGNVISGKGNGISRLAVLDSRGKIQSVSFMCAPQKGKISEDSTEQSKTAYVSRKAKLFQNLLDAIVPSDSAHGKYIRNRVLSKLALKTNCLPAEKKSYSLTSKR